ncbi:MAG: acyl-CoA dehydrogenase family protein [Candidatus Binatia bacterium]
MRRELTALVALAGATRDAGARQQVAQLAIEVQIAKLTAYRNVTVIQRTGQPGPEGSILKLFWSEVEQRLMEVACALLGPAAQLTGAAARRTGDVDWTRELLWTRSATIYAGTSEVQRNIIAQRVLGLPR